MPRRRPIDQENRFARKPQTAGARDDVFAATTPSVDLRRPGAGGGATYFAMTPPPSNTFMGLVYPKFGLFGNPVKPDGTL